MVRGYRARKDRAVDSFVSAGYMGTTLERYFGGVFSEGSQSQLLRDRACVSCTEEHRVPIDGRGIYRQRGTFVKRKIGDPRSAKVDRVVSRDQPCNRKYQREKTATEEKF